MLTAKLEPIWNLIKPDHCCPRQAQISRPVLQTGALRAWNWNSEIEVCRFELAKPDLVKAQHQPCVTRRRRVNSTRTVLFTLKYIPRRRRGSSLATSKVEKGDDRKFAHLRSFMPRPVIDFRTFSLETGEGVPPRTQTKWRS